MFHNVPFAVIAVYYLILIPSCKLSFSARGVRVAAPHFKILSYLISGLLLPFHPSDVNLNPIPSTAPSWVHKFTSAPLIHLYDQMRVKNVAFHSILKQTAKTTDSVSLLVLRNTQTTLHYQLMITLNFQLIASYECT
jgi:hypothetical protein